MISDPGGGDPDPAQEKKNAADPDPTHEKKVGSDRQEKNNSGSVSHLFWYADPDPTFVEIHRLFTIYIERSGKICSLG